MKSFARFLLVMLCATPFATAQGVVSSTAGHNLTAYNGESGATNNNQWNNLMNSRSGGSGTTATADFGNCNAVIMRCAQPKCSSGCTDLNVTMPIVSGCVQSNAACKQYGDELTEYIAAQLVAQSTAKANAAAQSAQIAAQQAAAQQSAQQLQQMQAQMQQMQSQMAQQNAQTVAQLQNALEEQKQLTADAIAQATAAQMATQQPVQQYATTTVLNDSQIAAAEAGVSADVLAREQISGQILSGIENSETQLKTLKATMTDAFEYAHCDSRGNNCEGPKRVKIFKQKAEGFFDPYESVLDEMYDALILAQSVGVDINDIYMMLNGSCNVWGKYLCENDQALRYTTQNCFVQANSATGTSMSVGSVLGGAKCEIGKIIPPADGGCQPLGMLNDDEEVRYNWLYPENGEESRIRVGCMSEIIESAGIFRNRKKQASIDIETLQRIIVQDASSNAKADDKPYKYCAAQADDLKKLAELKRLPDTNKICGKINNDGLFTSAKDCETGEDINPILALCSTHAYNIGMSQNPEKDNEKQDMREVIALKSTVIAQQMFKQYEYLESMIKRFRTQLEKAVLTTKLKVAGADTDDGSSKSGFKITDSNIKLAGAQNCKQTSYQNAHSCLTSNVQLVMNAVNGGNNIGEAKSQLAVDIEAAKIWKIIESTPTQCANLKNDRKVILTCAEELNAEISINQSLQNRQQNQQNRNMNTNMGWMN
ncbi:MAG: hypothetical protein J5679_03345 [Alphaproteobacteria bacterium]|nr:hypothetical protein [Alphaproteobacteria bacterium]